MPYQQVGSGCHVPTTHPDHTDSAQNHARNSAIVEQFQEAIFKEANFCAKKFFNANQQDNMFKFIKYCGKKINKVLLKRETEDMDVNHFMKIWNLITNLTAMVMKILSDAATTQ